MLCVSVLIGLILSRSLLLTTRTLYCYEVDPRVADQFQCHLSSGNICLPFSRQTVGQDHVVMKKSIEIKKLVALVGSLHEEWFIRHTFCCCCWT